MNQTQMTTCHDPFNDVISCNSSYDDDGNDSDDTQRGGAYLNLHDNDRFSPDSLLQPFADCWDEMEYWNDAQTAGTALLRRVSSPAAFDDQQFGAPVSRLIVVQQLNIKLEKTSIGHKRRKNGNIKRMTCKLKSATSNPSVTSMAVTNSICEPAKTKAVIPQHSSAVQTTAALQAKTRDSMSLRNTLKTQQVAGGPERMNAKAETAAMSASGKESHKQLHKYSLTDHANDLADTYSSRLHCLTNSMRCSDRSRRQIARQRVEPMDWYNTGSANDLILDDKKQGNNISGREEPA
jgi:hypothetical protein